MKKQFAMAFTILAVSSAASAQQVIIQAGPPPVIQAPPVAMQAPPPVIAQQPYCRPYSDKFTIGNEVRINRGLACMQPDGAWQLQPSTAGVNYVTRGGMVYVTSAQPFAGVVVVDRHHHHDY